MEKPQPEATGGFLVELTGISKSFGATHALKDVDLRLRAGEVHALVGENGAGKSTLVKILSGAVKRDGGTVLYRGRPFEPRGPAHTLRRGIVVIYQEFNLAGHLNAAQNIFLGQETTRFGLLSDGRAIEKTRAILAQLGADFDVRVPVHRLSVAQRQLVEIGRALALKANVVVMDEPTATLSPEELNHLFEVIRKLKERGVGVIYISHRLEEIFRIADRYTVLRDGRHIQTGRVASTDQRALIAAMVGRDLSELYPRVEHEVGEPVLEVRGLSRRPVLRDVDLTVRRGEIVGIAGLVGSGRTELLRAIFGLDRAERGTIALAGRALERLDARRAVRAGLGLLSEDRAGEGLALRLSVAANVTLSNLSGISFGPVLRLALERDVVRSLAAELAIRMRSPAQPAGALSGGNQQKVAVARMLFSDCEVLLLDEPTRGIDVAAKADMFRLIGALAARGKGVLMVSSYLPELLGVADSIAVMREGRLSEKFGVAQLTQEKLLAMMTPSAKGAA